MGQNIEKLNPINNSDFSSEKLNYSKIIQQYLLVTFPFASRPGKFGADDEQFKLKYETSVRLNICKESKDFYFIAGPYVEDSEINIQSIIKYTLEKQKIIQRKLKKDEFEVIVSDSTFILDFSGLIDNPSTIIDLKYSITTNNKTQIIALLYNNKIYDSYSIRLEITEI